MLAGYKCSRKGEFKVNYLFLHNLLDQLYAIIRYKDFMEAGPGLDSVHTRSLYNRG